MRRKDSSLSSARAATTISAVAAALLLFSLAGLAETSNEGRPSYSVPIRYQPEPGVIDRERNKRVVVSAAEFSFFVSGKELAVSIEGFDHEQFGISHGTTVIVRNFSQRENDEWVPSAEVIRGWGNFWFRRGNKKSACVAEAPDDVTGLIRYHTLCDPEPSFKSTIYLMDRRPDASLARPASQDYIRATCRIDTAIRAPGVGRFHQCKFRRMTPWGAQIQFRLKGNNVALMDDVEQYLTTLLSSWHAV